MALSFFSPFGSLALASVLRCLPCVLLLRWTFLWSFYPSQLSSSVLSPPSHDSVPLLVCAPSFLFFLPNFRSYLSHSFRFLSIHRYRFSCVVACVVPPSSVGGLVDCFSFLFLFPRVCAVLSHSFTVLSVSSSFFLQYFPINFSVLGSLLSFLLRSLWSYSPQFSSVLFLSLMCFRDSLVRLSCVFLSCCSALSSPSRVPHLFFGRFFLFLYCLCFSPVLCVYPPTTGFP